MSEPHTPWPHAPTHQLGVRGTYFVTASTYLKAHHFRGRPLHPPDGALAALGHNHHQVHIAIFMGRAPRVRTEQKNLLRLEFGPQQLHGSLQQT